MKNQLILIILLFISLFTSAQTKELSVGSGVLFNGYTGNVMYRKYNPESKSALRVQVSSFNLLRETKNPFQTTIYNSNAITDNLKKNTHYSFGVGLYVGKQKEIKVHDKFLIYKGFDMGFTCLNNNSKRTENIYYNLQSDTIRVYSATRRESKQNDLGIYYNSFLGLQYQLMPNLFLSLEPKLSLALTRHSFVSNSKHYSIANETVENPRYNENYEPTVNYQIRLNPIANLWISYRFK